MSLDFLRAWRPRALRAGVWALLAVVVLLGAALAFGERHARGLILHLITARTGREARIDGPFALRLFSRNPVLDAQQVLIGNPPWMSPGVTARAQALTLRLKWQLSLPPLRLEYLEAHGVELTLARDAQGRPTWHLRPEGPGRGPPLLHGLDVPDAHVTLRDERRHLDFAGTVSALDHSDSGDSGGLKIAGSGRLNGHAAAFTLAGDALAGVRAGKPYHFVFGLPLPQSSPFTLSGGFEREQKRFVYRDLAAHFGKSDLGGTLQVDSSSGRAHVTGGLSSHLLLLSDFGKGSSAPAAAAEPAPEAPPAPINIAALKRS